MMMPPSTTVAPSAAADLTRHAGAWVSGCPAIDGARTGRLPLLEGAGDEDRPAACGAEGNIGDVRCWHDEGAHELTVLVHHEHAAGAIMRDVVIAVRAELE